MQKQLPRNYGFAIDERVVEYPWFFSRLRNDEKIILDAGATLNHSAILTLPILKNRQLFIATLHPEEEYNGSVSPTYVYEDLRRTSFSDEQFDVIACLSTLEHIGMDNSYLYVRDSNQRENNKYAFLDAIKEFKRILKKGGRLFLSMPYGRYQHHPWLQVFDGEMVAMIKEEFQPEGVEESYFKYENGHWDFANADACKNSRYFDIHKDKTMGGDYLAASQSVVCLVLIK
jgi:SAM-dependent methyltransferase